MIDFFAGFVTNLDQKTTAPLILSSGQKLSLRLEDVDAAFERLSAASPTVIFTRVQEFPTRYYLDWANQVSQSRDPRLKKIDVMTFSPMVLEMFQSATLIRAYAGYTDRLVYAVEIISLKAPGNEDGGDELQKARSEIGSLIHRALMPTPFTASRIDFERTLHHLTVRAYVIRRRLKDTSSQSALAGMIHQQIADDLKHKGVRVRLANDRVQGYFKNPREFIQWVFEHDDPPT